MPRCHAAFDDFAAAIRFRWLRFSRFTPLERLIFSLRHFIDATCRGCAAFAIGWPLRRFSAMLSASASAPLPGRR
jgi:hypothetical protein